MEQINAQNCNYSSYTSKNLQVFISFSAAPLKNSEDCQFSYCVTVTNFDFEEVYQKSFTNEEDALQFINQKYGHWEYNATRGGKNTDGDGCGSCGAH